MGANTNMASLEARYGDPLAVLDRVPRNASELYRRWTELPDDATFSTSHRKRRRTLARYLTHLATHETIINGRRVIRSVITDKDHRTRIAFWCEVVPDAAGGDQPGGAAHLRHSRVVPHR